MFDLYTGNWHVKRFRVLCWSFHEFEKVKYINSSYTVRYCSGFGFSFSWFGGGIGVGFSFVFAVAFVVAFVVACALVFCFCFCLRCALGGTLRHWVGAARAM